MECSCALSPRLVRALQVPAFAAIGVIGYLVDAMMTYVCAKYLGLSPVRSRPPGITSMCRSIIVISRCASQPFHN
jgi:putative flippase GtrA